MSKKVDESWKDNVQKENDAIPAADAQPEVEIPAFLQFVSTLAMQALVFLGELTLQEGAPARTDLPQAKYMIDVIKLLEDKTKGNLTEDEAQALKSILYELQIKFVEKSESRLT